MPISILRSVLGAMVTLGMMAAGTSAAPHSTKPSSTGHQQSSTVTIHRAQRPTRGSILASCTNHKVSRMRANRVWAVAQRKWRSL